MNTLSTIRFFKRAEIDTTRWDAFIKNSAQYRIYALSNWLDHLSPGWSALINADYSVVMPLPVKKKYGISYLAQPRFTQQLGLYSARPLSPAVAEDFLYHAAHLFSFAEIFLNTGTGSDAPAEKDNYILPLNNPYPEIRSRYSRSLTDNSLRPASKNQLKYIQQTDTAAAIDQYRQLYQQRMGLEDAAYHQLEVLAAAMKKTGNCFTRQVIITEGRPVATSLFFIDRQRIYNLCSATPPEGRKLNANYFLYDQLIREFAGSGLILDFEGSTIPGIAAFYKKFGAHPEPYYFVKWNRLKWPLKIFKK
ncbi:GNAT family N-acetyltransferase [Niabella beijingensis]|uniref:GNAT family N-acetyltransferase n=1 Tax=Niabella beijingensis TaxID=2872700 RepID=UPI001CC0D5C5|nr:GNAT family N-acetyltransferase [Niabella beijingensis]MBZ4192112.1 GNAT family N-acetyltransferase [Niabella beijingensis]